MTRVHLAQLLRDLTSAHDYAFFSAPDEYMPSEIDRYPAAWLAPPRLKEVEGRRRAAVQDGDVTEVVSRRIGGKFLLF